ncbi:glycine betaine ABC transporter substrate-binding protein OsmF [Pelagibacterium limicola]|uniref:glycine betaine ABC transporter substrate-binding protein OsmF n=1 Tax=Pelagibacterium limicola TaxID=2791022 RepID=UPI0018AF725B|nr:ABC transporter substrate-binding protein [Pelagibacterium limicola]
MPKAKALFGAIAAIVFAATAASAQVVVSSKIDTEGGVLGNIIKQVLETNDIAVIDRIQLGATPIVREAILAGEIDIYPEYTGNGAFFFDRAEEPVWNDAAKAYAEVARMDYEVNQIAWLHPSPANNTWAVALRSDLAQANDLSTFTQFGQWVSAGGEVKLAASSEFVNSPAALPKFQETYGFTLSPDQLVVLSGGDTAATIAAAAQQTNGVNAAMVYGTDGGIGASGLTVLEDDQGVQPVYQPAPIIREEVLTQYPEIENLLGPVFEALTLEVLQDLNGRVQIGGEPAASVATDFLTENGFLG